MTRFLALLSTVVISGLITGGSLVLRWLGLPGGAAPFVAGFGIVPAGPILVAGQFVLHAAMHWLMTAKTAVIAAQTETGATPPPSWFVLAAQCCINPTPSWLWWFAIPVVAVDLLTMPLVLAGPIPALLWGWGGLYGMTLVAAALQPDPAWQLTKPFSGATSRPADEDPSAG